MEHFDLYEKDNTLYAFIIIGPMYHSFCGLLYNRLCSTTARRQDAVPSGRRLRLKESLESENVYISIITL